MCFIENAWLCKPNLIKSHNSYFIVPDEKLDIQVSYSIKEETTYNREVPPQEGCSSIVEFHILKMVFVITVIVITFCKDTKNTIQTNKNTYIISICMLAKQ